MMRGGVVGGRLSKEQYASETAFTKIQELQVADDKAGSPIPRSIVLSCDGQTTNERCRELKDESWDRSDSRVSWRGAIYLAR
jgi:hypothetical protein